MNVLVAVADPGLRTLWEGILTDHGHRPVAVTPDLRGWDEVESLFRDIAVVFDMAIVELSPAYPESLELGRRLRAQAPATRPSLMVLVQPGEATEMIIALKSGVDDVVLGHPDRRTAVAHLAALERRRHVARPALPTAGQLASGLDLPGPALPPVGRESVSAPPTDDDVRPAADVPATILLIDDEPTVRYPLRLALQHVGYRVIEAGDGEEGLEVIARRGDEIALVVVDQRMPRVSGLEVLRQVRRRRRRVPVVLMSGYPSLDPPEGKAGPDAFLRKPFELLDLARTVQRLMDGEAAQA